MNINFDYYKVFYYVAKLGNITKCAELMYISQPAVSKTIKNLENDLKCKLFVRNKNGVILTEEGKTLYQELKLSMEAISGIEDKINELINLETGTIKVGASKTIVERYLMNIIEIFHRKYPKIKFEVHTEKTDILLNKVRHGLVDFLVINNPLEVPNDFYYENVKEVHDIFVVSNKYQKDIKKDLKLSELNDYDLILTLTGSNVRNNFNEICSKNKIILNPKMELTSTTLVKDFVKAGFGIGLLTEELFTEELKNNLFYKLNVSPSIAPRYIGICYLKNKMLSKADEKFLQMLMESKNE